MASRSPFGGLWRDALHEKRKCAADSFAQTVRPGKINRPAPNHRGVESLHELGKVRHGERFRDLPALLAFREDLSQQADSNFFGAAHFGGAHRIHRSGKHDRSPQRPVGFHLARHALIHSPQSFRGGDVAREFRLEMLLDATVAASTDFPQDSIFARKVAKKRGLADFEDLDDVLDSGVLVTMLAEQANRGVNDLLPQPSFLALAKA